MEGTPPGIQEGAPAVSPPCPSCGAAAAEGGAPAAPQHIYALGHISARFPSVSIEREFAQAAGRHNTKGLTDAQVRHQVLSDRQGRYLVRKLCWVMTVEGLETYILVPRDMADYDLLIEALRERPQPTDLDVVIGMKGPSAPPEFCGGLQVPIVAFDQIYSFDRESLIKAIPRPEKLAPKAFAATAEELLDRLMQMADNAGATDEHRAVNYLTVRYHRIYELASECHGRNFSLTSVETVDSRLSGVRRVMDVIFSFTHRESGVVEKHFARVDVTEEFPFLVTPLSPYYDR